MFDVCLKPGAGKISVSKIAMLMLLGSTMLSGCGSSEDRLTAGRERNLPAQQVSIDPNFVSGSRAVTAKTTEASKPADDKDVKPIDLTPYLLEAAKKAEQAGEVLAAAQSWQQLYEKDATNLEISFNYARSLRRLGVTTEAEKILVDALQLRPNDLLLRLELSKVKLAQGNAKAALPIIEKLVQERPHDPGILQAYGVILDRLSRHADAQYVYGKAMEIGRNSASLLNNAALSHAMSGDLASAEKYLREALVARGANVQIKQNLALVLMLKGDEKGAREMATDGVPKEMAEKTLAYFASLGTQRDVWSALKNQQSN